MILKIKWRNSVSENTSKKVLGIIKKLKIVDGKLLFQFLILKYNIYNIKYFHALFGI